MHCGRRRPFFFDIFCGAYEGGVTPGSSGHRHADRRAEPCGSCRSRPQPRTYLLRENPLRMCLLDEPARTPRPLVRARASATNFFHVCRLHLGRGRLTALCVWYGNRLSWGRMAGFLSRAPGLPLPFAPYPCPRYLPLAAGAGDNGHV